MSEQRERDDFTLSGKEFCREKARYMGDRRNNSVRGRGKRTETERKDMVVEEGAEPEKV